MSAIHNWRRAISNDKVRELCIKAQKAGLDVDINKTGHIRISRGD